MALLVVAPAAAVARSSAAVAGPAVITVSSPGDLTTVLGNVVFQHVNATDTGGTLPLAYTATGLPASLSINPTTGLIIGMPALADVAASPYNVTVTVGDANPADTPVSVTFTWTIEYSTPTVTSPGNQTSAPGATVNLPIRWSNTGPAGVHFLAAGLPAGLAIGPSNGYISGTITAADLADSPYHVTVTIYDDSGSPATPASSTTFTWTVANTIAVTSPADQSSPPNTKVALQIKAVDSAPGEPLAYAATGLPGGLAIDPATGLISGTTTKADIGPHTVIVTVTNPTSTTARVTFTWSVAVNKITVTAPALVQSKVGVAVPGVKITAKDAANGQTLTFTASSLPAGLTINHATGVISGKPKSLAADMTVVTATDTTGSTGSAVIKWKVGGVISIKDPGVRTIHVGEPVNLPLAVTDNAAHDKLTVKASGLPAGVTLQRNPLALRGRPTSAGTYQVIITVSGLDGGFARVRFRITVKPGHSAIAMRIVLPRPLLPVDRPRESVWSVHDCLWKLRLADLRSADPERRVAVRPQIARVPVWRQRSQHPDLRPGRPQLPNSRSHVAVSRHDQRRVEQAVESIRDQGDRQRYVAFLLLVRSPRPGALAALHGLLLESAISDIKDAAVRGERLQVHVLALF
jgi:hypothetical protein